MRVISQDGTLDIPYEEVIIQKFRSRIYFLNKNLTGVESLSDDMQIAEYSTEAKALKAMEMCRKRYAIAEYNRRIIPKGDTPVMETAKELLTSGFIFQFPQDDEIEV